MPEVFDKDAIMRWNGDRVSDHNRAGLSVGTERIESSNRMANGTLRKYVVADKRTFRTSWEDLPHNAANTVDGFWGAREMEAFYKANAGVFTLGLTYGDGTTENVAVVFTNFDKEITKRGLYEFTQVSVEMEEA